MDELKSIAARLVLVLGIITLSVIAVILIVRFIFPVVIGWVISLIFYRPSRIIERVAKIPFSVSIIASMAAFFTLLSGTAIGCGILFWPDIQRILRALPAYSAQLAEALQSFFSTIIVENVDNAENWLISKGLLNKETALTIVASIEQQAVSFIEGVGKTVMIELSTIVGLLPNTLISTVITLLSAYFFVKEKTFIDQKLKSWFPQKTIRYCKRLKRSLKHYIWSYIQAQMLLLLVTVVIVLIGLLQLNVEGAPALALIAGLLDLIPLIGTGILFIPWIFYSWINGFNKLALGLAIIQIMIILLRQLLEPRVLGTKLGLHPFLTFLLMYVCFQLFGFAGVVLTPILLLSISALKRAEAFQLLWIYIKKGTIS
ncbi:sporulation integral membrane protein YtvI [Jeotgalibacillus soli]|uniref:Sporulation integral membrane protein YtvI n=1 Tax=Jeotgalibacillus soli TaxID=889306 RepID=A0A0C2VH29_9BACL|nr:sporulation integral membrane protein YtvI [Jeotgalibacillus soli]KIL43821.1 hypothetical protein KP78_36450 [Jeotgalibacillus soli]